MRQWLKTTPNLCLRSSKSSRKL